MVLSRPVVIWVALSAASACSAEKVCARNVGTVHVTAEPSAVVRRNSRRVLRESSGFIQNQIGWLLDWLIERAVPGVPLQRQGYPPGRWGQRALPHICCLEP